MFNRPYVSFRIFTKLAKSCSFSKDCPSLNTRFFNKFLFLYCQKKACTNYLPPKAIHLRLLACKGKLLLRLLPEFPTSLLGDMCNPLLLFLFSDPALRDPLIAAINCCPLDPGIFFASV